MKRGIIFLVVLFFLTNFAFGQMMKRQDAIWARTAPANSIVVDGRLDEPAWAKAESVVVYYGKSSGLPGSGWKDETGVKPTDPTRAVLKFLVSGNNLYIGAFVPDSSVGGGLFNMFDGFLMNMRNHAAVRRDPAGHYFPAPPFEYFYGWVTESWADPNTGLVGASPGFFGWAGGPRSEGDSLANIWYAVTRVLGVSNTDTASNGSFSPDTGYVVELRINLTPRGYDVTRPQGDVIEFNISIYDADWQWPFNPDKFSGNRSWWQGPWGNASWYNVARIYARPDVGLDTPLPEIPPDVTIPNGRLHPAPVIDGDLSETVWKNLRPTVNLVYGDTAVIYSYPGVGPYRSGYFKPDGAGPGQVLDPGNASVKVFYRGDTLYIGVDIQDQVVTSRPDYDKWDGIRVIIEDRGAVNPDGVLEQRDLILRLDSTGKALVDGYLKYLVDSLNAAKVGVRLKGTTTVNDYNDVDEGWTAEIAIDLTKLGYPPGRGDGVLFFSATLFDYDEFQNPNDNYGTRTWFFREMPVFSAGPAWGYLSDVDVPVKVPEDIAITPSEFRLLGNYPNPFNPTTNIMFTMPYKGNVTLKVYDVIGRTVSIINLGEYESGYYEYEFNASNLSSGIYFYQLEMKGERGSVIRTGFGKMALIK